MNIPKKYNPFIAIVLLFSIISILNIPVIETLWKYSFDDGTYSHAYLIPFITLFLYFKLSEIGKLVFKEKISFIALFLVFSASLLLFITTNAQVSVGYWLSIYFLILASITALFRFNFYMLFPALFLIFIIPMWGVLTNILQSISVTAVTYMMSFTNIPTYVETQFITIPSGTFEIADGCSGLRYIIVSLAISSLFIFLNISNVKKAAAFFTFAILGALLTNWIRITALIVIGDYTDMQSSLMEDHNTFGWYLYIPFMFLLFKWGNKLSDEYLFDTDEKQSHITLVNIKSLILVISIVVLSSTTFKGLLNNSSIPENIQKTNVTPLIHLYSDINVIKNTENTTHLVYQFNGDILDGTPTFYDNKLIPEKWNAISTKTTDTHQYYEVIKNNQKAIISVSYQIDDFTTSSSKRFKIERLKRGLTFSQKVQLHWTFNKCNKQCDLPENN